MSKGLIVSAKVYDDDPEQIVVELDNGSILMLELAPKLGDPLFAQIKDLSLPQTDGHQVYWSNGARLSLNDIMDMITDETDA